MPGEQDHDLDQIILKAQQAELDTRQMQSSPEYPRSVVHDAINGKAGVDDVVSAAQAASKQQADGKLKAGITIGTLADETFYALNHAVDYVGAKAMMGRKDVAQNIIYSEAFFGGRTLEDAKKNADEARMEQLRAENIDPIENTIPGNLLLRIFGETAQALPGLSQIQAGGVAGSAVGVGVGALGGPAAPASMTAGAATGGIIGGAAAGMRLGIGAMYKKATDAGVDPNVARAAAFGFGSITGVMQMAGGKALSAVAEKASLAALTAPAGQAAIQKAMYGLIKEMPDFGKDLSVQTALGMAQELTSVVTEGITSVATGKEKLSPTYGVRTNPETGKQEPIPAWEVLGKRFLESLISQTASGVGTVAGAAGLGGASKFAEKKLAQQDLVNAVKNAAKAMNTMSKEELAASKAQENAALDVQIEHAKLEAKHINMKEKVSNIKKKIREAKLEGKPTAGLEANLKVAELEKRKADREFNDSQSQIDSKQNISPLSSQERRATVAGAKAKEARKLFNRLAKGVRKRRAQGEKPTPEELQALRDAEMDAMTMEEEARTAKLSASIAEINKRIDRTGSNAKLEVELKGKLTQLSKEAIEGRLTRLQAQIENESQFIAEGSRAKSDENKVKAINKAKGRLVKLRTDKHNLEQVKDMLESNPLSADALESFHKDVQTARSADLFRKASRLVLKAGISGRAGGVFDVGANRKALEGLITSSGLSRESRNKLPKITEIDTPQKLQDFLTKLEAAVQKGINKEALADAHSDLQAALNRPTTRERGPREEGLVSYDDQEVIQLYKGMIADAITAKPEGVADRLYSEALAKRTALQEKALTDPLNEAEIAQMDKLTITMTSAADVINTFTSGDTKQMKNLAARLEDIIKTGRMEQLDIKAAEIQRDRQILAEVIRKAQGNKPVTRETIEKAGITGGIKKAARTHGIRFESIQQLWEEVFLDSKDHELPRAIDPHDSVQNELTFIRQGKNDLVMEVTKGEKRLIKAQAEVTTRQYQNDVEFQWVDQDGGVRTFKGSVAQAMKARNMLMNPNRRQGLVGRVKEDGTVEGNRITFDVPQDGERNHPLKYFPAPTFETALRNSLTKEQHELADGYLRFYNGEKNTKFVQDHYMKVYKLPMELQAVYDGPGQRTGVSDFDGSHLEVFNRMMGGGQRSLAPGSTIKLTKDNFTAYEFKPIVEDANQYIKATRSWVAMSELNGTINRVLASKELKGIVEHKLNKDAWQILKAKYELTVGTRGMQHVQQDKLVQHLKGATGVANTAGKAINALAQISGFVNIIQKEGVPAVVAGAASYASNPIKAHKIVADTQYWVNRRDAGDNVVTHDGMMALPKSWRFLEPGVVAGHKATKALVDVAAGGIRFFDYLVHSLGYVAYHAEYQRQIKKNPNDVANAHSEGLRNYERVMNQTQGSSTKDQQSYWQQASDVHSWFAQFTSQPKQAYLDQVIALKRLVAQPSVKNSMDAARIVFAAHLAQGMFQAIKTAPDWLGDDDKKADDALITIAANDLVGPVGIPILGDMLVNADTELLNKFFGTKAPVFELKAAPYDIANHTNKFYSKVLDVAFKGDGTDKDFIEAVSEFAKGPAYAIPGNFGKLPLREGVKQAKGYYERQGKKPVYNEPVEEVPVNDSNDNIE